MTILDANVLLYAYNADSVHHVTARQWLEALADSGELIGLPWVTIWAFLRISTNPRLFHPPMAVNKAFEKIAGLLALPNTVIVQPGPRHVQILERIVTEAQAAGPKLTDAVLAALATEHGAALASTDRGFSRFKTLKWIDPLLKTE